MVCTCLPVGEDGGVEAREKRFEQRLHLPPGPHRCYSHPHTHTHSRCASLARFRCSCRPASLSGSPPFLYLYIFLSVTLFLSISSALAIGSRRAGGRYRVGVHVLLRGRGREDMVECKRLLTAHHHLRLPRRHAKARHAPCREAPSGGWVASLSMGRAGPCSRCSEVGGEAAHPVRSRMGRADGHAAPPGRPRHLQAAASCQLRQAGRDYAGFKSPALNPSPLNATCTLQPGTP